MSSINYTDDEYKTYLEMDKYKHLLVEGRDDFFLFHILCEEFLGTDWGEICNVVVDKAELLLSQDNQPRGNREKIEEICKSYFKENLVGFVDREYRNFEMQDSIVDQMQSHYQDRNLIWSRGHSIENYYFDSEIFRGPFQDVCGEYFQKAFALFKKYIDSYLRTMCTLSLLGLKHNNHTERIRASVIWNVIASNGELDVEAWKTVLSSHLGLEDEEIANLASSLLELLDLVSKADIKIIKWLSHGHLGFCFLWNAFARCIYDSLDGEDNVKRKKANAFLNLNNQIRFNMCGRSWAKAAASGKAEFPTPVFELLGING